MSAPPQPPTGPRPPVRATPPTFQPGRPSLPESATPPNAFAGGATGPQLRAQPFRRTAMWLDPSPLNREWDAPRWYDRFSLRQRLAALVLAVALVVAGLWAGGAFRESVNVTRLDWRTPVRVGGLEFTITGAFVESGDQTVVVKGACRQLDEREDPLPRDTLRLGVGLGTDAGFITYKARRAGFGPGDLSGQERDVLPVGAEPIPCYVSGDAGADYTPAGSVTVLIFAMHYNDGTQAQLGAKGWDDDNPQYLLRVPLTVLDKPA